jgi:hypothetical protein
MKFINNPMDAFAEKKALLEEAPSPKVFNFLLNLTLLSIINTVFKNVTLFGPKKGVAFKKFHRGWGYLKPSPSNTSLNSCMCVQR